MRSNKPIIGISIGDLNGIGPEIVLKTFANSDMFGFCTPVIFASGKVMSFHKKTIGLENIGINSCRDHKDIKDKKLNVINLWKEDIQMNLGTEDPQIGKYAAQSLTAASKALKAGHIDALVTAPINKAAIQGEEFNFKGHTDYLESEFEGSSLMLLLSEEMRMALATIHIAVNEIPGVLTQDLILSKLKTLDRTLVGDFHIRKPKIAVLALNPHAGDKGLMGKEEGEIITPAIEKAFGEGIMAFGPFPADSFFGSGKHTKYDAILAMYHDQGLIPFKSLSFGKGVNFTAGLNIVRTSPDHGTGLDIAGKNKAGESSFREALLTAVEVWKKRQISHQITKNPLVAHKSKD